jgi:GNAT superfamily N-acetyltransferase
MAYLALVLRLLLGTVCLVAASGKLFPSGGLRRFGRMLAAVGVPAGLVAPVGAAIIGMELTVAVLAPWQRTGVGAMVLASALMAALTAGVARMVRRDTAPSTAPVICACFGRGSTRLTRVHIARNGGLTCLAMLAAATGAAPGTASLHPAGVALSAVVAGVGTLVVVFWEDLSALLGRV